MQQLLETACDRARVAVLFNPASGSDDPGTRRALLEDVTRAAGLTCALRETDADDGAGPLAAEAVRDGMERLLVSGGDGSVTEAAGALVGSNTALAVVPGGTGNLLAANLGLPTDCAAAVTLALEGEARPFDVGRANGSIFLIMAGMGLDARMIHDADRELKDRLGVLAYFVAGIRNLGRRPAHYSITIDGQRLERRAQTVLVANLGRITGGLELVPGASAEDGLLDVAILHARGFHDLVGLAADTLLGRPQHRSALELHRGRQIVIESRRAHRVQLDGNEAPTTRRLQVSVEPGALRLVRPPATAQELAAAAPATAVLGHARRVAWSLLGGAAVGLAAYALRRRNRRRAGSGGQ